VVSGVEAGAVWKRLVDSVRGFYDPITGDRDSAKYEAVHRGTLRELAARLHATFWLHDTITVVTAHWSHNAECDGMTDVAALLHTMPTNTRGARSLRRLAIGALR